MSKRKAVVLGVALFLGAIVLPAAAQEPPAAGARAYLVHRSGQTQVVAERITVAAPAAGAAQGDMFSRTVRVLAQAANSNARTQPNRQGMIRPIPGEPVLVSPRNGLKVNDVRPTFSWMAVEGAHGYTLQLRTDGERPRRFEVGKATAWTLPAAEAALVPSKQYQWTVAPAGGRPTREVQFTVIGDEDRRQLASGIESISGMGLDPRGDGRLLSVVVFTDLGLYYDAADALGHLDEARAAFDRADALLRG